MKYLPHLIGIFLISGFMFFAGYEYKAQKPNEIIVYKGYYTDTTYSNPINIENGIKRIRYEVIVYPEESDMEAIAHNDNPGIFGYMGDYKRRKSIIDTICYRKEDCK